ncbi:MAG: MATE family efflux transporter [Dehalococcoidia bacterium]|nr:MAG: MATE family efflux transporter [Dehalococcoidia bacterium]
MRSSSMNDRRQNVLDDDRIGQLMLKLSLPALVGLLVMTMYNVVDTIFVGHYVGSLGIAGLTIVFPAQMLTMAIGQMMGMGGASLISRLIGAGNTRRAEHALGNALTSAVVLSVLVMIAGLSNTDMWLRLMGASETVLPYAREYMSIILLAVPFKTMAMAQSSLIRAEGNARVPMTGMIIGAVLNIILDAIFIILLDMGIRGAALGTLIASLVTVLYFMSYYLSGKSFLKIHTKSLVIEWGILGAILAIGIAAFASLSASSLTVVFINRALATFGGDVAISAYGLLNRIMMFAFLPGIVIAQGLQPILGFNYGAKRYDRVLQAIKIAVIAATTFSIIVFLAVYFAPEVFVRVFTTDGEVIAVGSYAAKRIFFLRYLIGFIIVGSTVFQAMGKAPQAFVTAIARPVLFLLPLVFILPKYWQLDGVWLAFPITDVLTFVLVLVLIIPQIRVFRRLDQENRSQGLTSSS